MALIDLSRIPPPDLLEKLDVEAYLTQLKTSFAAEWDVIRGDRPAIDTLALEHEPITGLFRAVAELRRFMTGHINDVVRALLLPLASGAELENIAARVNLIRLTLTPATSSAAAVMESDAALIRRVMLAFSQPAAGSPDRYRLEAFTALPILHDLAVIGRAVHGRKGDVDLVCAGPSGRALTNDELLTISTAVQASHVKPEATSVVVLGATRHLYDVAGTLTVARGPDPMVVKAEAESRIRKAAADRMVIGAEVPLNLLTGAAYGADVTRFDATAPTANLAGEPYTIPILNSVSLDVEVI